MCVRASCNWDCIPCSIPCLPSGPQSCKASASQHNDLPCWSMHTQTNDRSEKPLSSPCSICDWKNPSWFSQSPQAVTLGVSWENRGCLLAQSTALCKDKATMPCDKRACFWPCETPSLQDGMVLVHCLPVLVQILPLLYLTPQFNSTPRRTESLWNAERIYWLHLLKRKYKRLCSKCPEVLSFMNHS